MSTGRPLAAAVLLLHLLAALADQGHGGSSRPVIGVICHELRLPDCYIDANYVKAIEGSGARVAPIFLGKPQSYYRDMVKSLNGVVFPGGNASITTKGGYYEAASQVFTIARKLNYGGDHFPVLGVCLGLEFLADLSNMGRADTLEPCKGMENVMLPLDFRPGATNSSLYSSASERIIDILSKQKVNPNYHDFCLRPEKKLRHPWRLLTTNVDGDGREFVSSMETSGPMAAVQFHPEKCAYEWEQPNPSYEDALLASRHFYDWLVTEARRNNHSFPNADREEAVLIYNYQPTFTGAVKKSPFTQVYIFRNP